MDDIVVPEQSGKAAGAAMSRPETRQEKLQRLSTRVCAGEVVFFIGAGFSLDSEGNSTKVLIARLLARFEAMAGRLEQSRDSETAKTANRLRKGLRKTFDLDDRRPPVEDLIDIFDATPRGSGQPSRLDMTLASLAPNYYLINDWMCSAFDALLVSLRREQGDIPPDQTCEAMKDLQRTVRTDEDALLQRYVPGATLDDLDMCWYLELLRYASLNPGPARERAVAGKAMFLDTLGFNNPKVMAGEPLDPKLENVAKSAPRLRPRHRVLAWLAAEGLAAALVTTNYDLLLDLAYRLAGMQPLRPDSRLWTESKTPLDLAKDLRLPLNRRYRHFTRIAQATQFFSHGEAHESALIHKIHGCVETYRLARKTRDWEQVRRTLESIVFTFREIQNWREDSWSRDHLVTLMRTRTIVFAGYSAVDPVIHNTFRTVYEEVGDYRAKSADEHQSTNPTHKDGRRARAFFTDRAGVSSFHGLEILRAASKAAGDDPITDLTDHVNLLTFFTDEASFPTLDETFTWIYHLTARELQAQALESEVGRIGYQLFDRRCPDDEVKGLIESFGRLRAHEAAHARRFDLQVQPASSSASSAVDPAETAAIEARAAEGRRWFGLMTRWTSVFCVSLMREYQLGETLLRFPTDTAQIKDAARYPWYRPLTETPQWTAWSAILEMAIRRAVASYIGRPRDWLRPTADIEVVDAASPTIAFRAEPLRGRRRASPPVRRALTIKLANFWRRFGHDDPERLFAARTPIVWELQPHTVPWWTEKDPGLPSKTPPATTCWQGAAFSGDAGKADLDPATFFKDDPDVRQRHSA